MHAAFSPEVDGVYIVFTLFFDLLQSEINYARLACV